MEYDLSGGSQKEASAAREDKESVTLTRVELAYLNALIEEMLEERTGRAESVTIAVNPAIVAARWTKLVTKVTKKVTKATRYTWIVTELIDAVGGVFEATPSTLARQKEMVAKLREQLLTQNSLEDLIELRRKFEASADVRRKDSTCEKDQG